MARRLVRAARAELRVREAVEWLAARAPGEQVLVVGATADAASEVIREVTVTRGTGFGWHRFTLGRLAAELAKIELARRDLAPVGQLPIEALCARVVHRLRVDGRLGRLTAVVDQPGLPRALARTALELRMAGATTIDGDPELAAAVAALDEELARARLADRAAVYRIATEVAAGSEPSLLLGHALVLIDVPLRSIVERELVATLAARAPDVLATVPSGDEPTLRHLQEILHVEPHDLAEPAGDSLRRVQQSLFAPTGEVARLDRSVDIFSAPGESRECVEIARRVLQAAGQGVAFDRMAVLLRTPELYRVHLEEAMARAGVPVYFEQGTVMPDPSGRAFLALLACAVEQLSARRFAEYLSLGEVADAVAGEPPAAVPAGERWIPPDEELLPVALAATDEPMPERGVTADGPVAAGTLRTPWRWERLLVEAAVIGGRERWERRLLGLEAQLRLDDGEAGRESRERMLIDLAHLRAFALPLLDELARLPTLAPWGVWLERCGALATRALRRPERVLAVLAALAPMSEVGPVELREVQQVLGPRLVELVSRPGKRRYGQLLVAPIASARGLAFDHVFVPGLAERMFPQKLVEDPLLLDVARKRLGVELATRDDRLADERLALRLAIGAARERVILSYPRIDLDGGRPRVPSFYGLEVLEAAEGTLPGFDELAKRADVTGAARIGWPAPVERLDAIDDAEHDLALLDGLFRKHEDAPAGTAAYLLQSNEHLGRALRMRARRWTVKAWKPADGLIASDPASSEVQDALAAHALDARSFSPTALEHFAACPYRFALRTIAKLELRESPEAIETLGPLERGSLIHDVQFELSNELRAAGQLPVRPATLDVARDRLDAVLDRVAAQYRDTLCPAIDRVWNDGIAAIRADLREWLRRSSEDLEWTPRRFELGFGPTGRRGERDPASVPDAVRLDIGLSLRGSIDLVEEGPGGILRATDYKTGRAKVKTTAKGTPIIAGGTSLQPVLYALVLEKLFPEVPIAGGRLSYCTTRGDFQVVDVPLDDGSRAAAGVLADTLAHHARTGFYPPAPNKGECTYCDFRALCGPNEELRAAKKQGDKLQMLKKLRGQR
jgi:ATP-dependent helicase/nuclease subunit B